MQFVSIVDRELNEVTFDSGTFDRGTSDRGTSERGTSDRISVMKMPTPHSSKLKRRFNRKALASKSVMSTNKEPAEPDADTDEAPVGEPVNPSVSPSPDSVRRSSSPFRPKEPTSTSAVGGGATPAKNWLVPITIRLGKRASRRQYDS